MPNHQITQCFKQLKSSTGIRHLLWIGECYLPCHQRGLKHCDCNPLPEIPTCPSRFRLSERRLASPSLSFPSSCLFRKRSFGIAFLLPANLRPSRRLPSASSKLPLLGWGSSIQDPRKVYGTDTPVRRNSLFFSAFSASK